MEQPNNFDLACNLQAATFKQAGRFGLDCNRAIYTAAMTASAETVGTLPGHVVAAGTGTGKTTFTLALIAALVRSNPVYTAAFVTPTIEAAQAAYDALFKMLTRDLVSIHSSAHATASEATKRGGSIRRHFEVNGPSSRNSLVHARVAICTHEAWLGEGLSDISHGIRYHSSGHRKNVFVDEFPDTVRVQDIAASDLVELANELERHSDTRSLARSLIKLATIGCAETVGANSRFWLVQRLSDIDMIKLNSFDEKRLTSASQPDRCKAALTALKRSCVGQAFWVRTGSQIEGVSLGHKRLVTYSDSFRGHPGLIVLDATAAYAPHAQTMMTASVPKVQYPNLKICHLDGPRELKGECVSRLNKTGLTGYAKWIAKVVRHHGKASEASLVVVHKSVEDHVRDALRTEIAEKECVQVTHWGCDVGSNEYRDCKTVFMFSEFYQPRHVYLAKALGSTGKQATDYALRQATGQRSSGLVSEVEEAHLFRQFKQMASRGTARQVDDHGIAAPMRVITSMDRARLLRCLPELFPSAPAPVNLASPNTTKFTKGQKLASHLMQHMQARTRLALCATDIYGATGIMPKDLNRAFNSRECVNLEVFGWSFTPGAGRLTKPHLTYTPLVQAGEVVACAA